MLWKKVMPRLSAGRVQSVATRLVVDRERERIAFRSAGYWDIDAILDAGAEAEPPLFPARLTHVGEQRVAQGRDFDSRGTLVTKAQRARWSTSTRPRPRTWPPRCATAPFAVAVDRVQAVHPPAVRRRSGPRRCSRRPAASSASPRSGRCRWPRTCTRPASSPTCVPTRSTLSTPRSRAARNQVRQLFGAALPAGQAADLHQQGEERPGGARGDPAGRRDLPDPGPDPADR